MRARQILLVCAASFAGLAGCAAKKPPAKIIVPPGCRKEVELKTCHTEANNPDWCDGQYRMHFVCVKVIQ